eukprot:14884290-Alexandrium_andersonii.AAC.1
MRCKRAVSPQASRRGATQPHQCTTTLYAPGSRGPHKALSNPRTPQHTRQPGAGEGCIARARPSPRPRGTTEDTSLLSNNDRDELRRGWPSEAPDG